MSLDIYEQIEWHGMAEKGAGRRDPMTSVVEFNTQPGRESFQKVLARQDYFDGRIPSPAVQFIDNKARFVLKCGPTAATIGNKTVDVMSDEIIHTGDGTSRSARCVCFRHADYGQLSAGDEAHLFGDETAPLFYLIDTSSSWRLCYNEPDTAGVRQTHEFTAALTKGSWYWANAHYQESTTDVALYKDGGTAAIESARLSFAHHTNYAYNLYVGGDRPNVAFWGGEIAYAAAVEAGATKTFTPWQAEPGSEDVYAFYLHDPRKCYQPARILENPGSTQSVFVEYPERFWYEKGVSSPMAAIGVEVEAGRPIIWDAEGIELFRDLTVFMFYCTNPARADLLRNENGAFRIFVYTDDKIYVDYPGQDGGDELYQTYTNNTAFEGGTPFWMAVEFNPTRSDTGHAVSVYKCDIHTTGTTWTDVTNASSKEIIGGFSLEFLSDKWYLYEGFGGSGRQYLYDYRVVVGNHGWETAFTISSLTTSIPEGLVSWMNNVTNSDFVNEDRVGLVKAKNLADVTDWPVGCRDRVDGMVRFFLSPYHARAARSGCQYLTSGPMAIVEDMVSDKDGTLSFATDAYYYDAGTIRGQCLTRNANRALIAPVGTHRYIVNQSPLQVLHDYPRPVGIGSHRFFVNPTIPSAVFNFEGSLDFDTTYKYALTLYNPLTGDESFPHGPYHFNTPSAPASTAVDYGTPGCAVNITARLYCGDKLTDFYCKAYRYSTATGSYYYETTVPVFLNTYETAYSTWRANFEIPFRLDDDTLVLGNEVDVSNTLLPEHSVATIYDGRGFYVDLFKQSRLYFSKQYQVGTVSKTNLIWTDEGIGGDILGFLGGPDGLLLLRERSIWIIPPFADASAAWAYPLHPSIGCVSGSCAVWAGGYLWWASPLGLHSWDGQGLPQNHTQRVSGYDKKVWDHAPRRTIAYYDSREFKVVIACEGAGISIDINTGAIALVSAPERSYLDVQSSSYSGPVYGHVGGIFKQATAGNNSLTLSATAEACNSISAVSTAGTYGQLSWFWADGGESATHSVGIKGNATAFAAGLTYLSKTSEIGRTFNSLDSDYEELWSDTITDVVDLGSTASGILLRSEQSILDESGIEAIPFYYKSQPAYIGRSLRDHYFERMDIYTDDVACTTDGVADISFTSWIPGQTTAQTITQTAATIEPNQVHELHGLVRGNRFQYTIFSSGTADLPNILEVGVHLRSTRERGRNR